MSHWCSKAWISKQIQKLPILRGSFSAPGDYPQLLPPVDIYIDMVSLVWEISPNPFCRQSISENRAIPFTMVSGRFQPTSQHWEGVLDCDL